MSLVNLFELFERMKIIYYIKNWSNWIGRNLSNDYKKLFCNFFKYSRRKKKEIKGHEWEQKQKGKRKKCTTLFITVNIKLKIGM